MDCSVYAIWIDYHRPAFFSSQRRWRFRRDLVVPRECWRSTDLIAEAVCFQQQAIIHAHPFTPSALFATRPDDLTEAQSHREAELW